MVDTWLFLMHGHQFTIFILVYVDNFIFIGSPNAPFFGLLNSLQVEFTIKDLGLIYYFLNFEVQQTSKRLIFHQAKFILDILAHAKMIDA